MRITTFNGGSVTKKDLPPGIAVEVRLGKGADEFDSMSYLEGLDDAEVCGVVDMSVWGQRGNDNIDGANYADGGRGDDKLRACDLGSSLRGDQNADALYGGEGADDMSGNSGNDRIYDCGNGDSCDD